MHPSYNIFGYPDVFIVVVDDMSLYCDCSSPWVRIFAQSGGFIS